MAKPFHDQQIFELAVKKVENNLKSAQIFWDNFPTNTTMELHSQRKSQDDTCFFLKISASKQVIHLQM